VYRFGAERVLNGLDLYSTGYTGKPDELLFDYTPFSALCFVPLTLLGPRWIELLWLLGACALLGYAVARILRWYGLTPSRGLWSLAALLVGVSAWLEPVRLTATLGQINLPSSRSWSPTCSLPQAASGRASESVWPRASN
jgi:alpha-1,2-mannosyltransferase